MSSFTEEFCTKHELSEDAKTELTELVILFENSIIEKLNSNKPKVVKDPPPPTEKCTATTKASNRCTKPISKKHPESKLCAMHLKMKKSEDDEEDDSDNSK